MDQLSINMLIEKGGLASIFILISGAALIYFTVERMLFLFVKLNYNTNSEEDAIKGLLLGRRYTEAIQVCNKREHAPNLSVIKSGLLAVENGREAMRSAIGGAVLHVTHKCEKGIGYLALVANVATLLGLLGTITGLIKTFQSISKSDPAMKAQLLSDGIAEAMLATAVGLIVGITAMVIHSICSTKSDQIIGKSQDTGLKLITWVEQSERAPVHGKS